MKVFKSPVLISAIVVLIFIAGIYFGTKFNSTKKADEVTDTTPLPEGIKPEALINKSLSTDKTYGVLNNYTTFKVAYPEFKNVPADFNKKIADQVNAGIEQQKKGAAENWQARYETQAPGENIPKVPKTEDKFYFNVSWQATQENNSFISFLLTTSAYEGGAHGYEIVSSFNYDVVNKKDIKLTDLFPNDPNYLKTVSDFSRKNLEAQFRKSLKIKTSEDEKNFKGSIIPMMEYGTTPDEANFSVFTFTDDNITFYFNQYQVAPYSMGQSKVTMPRQK